LEASGLHHRVLIGRLPGFSSPRSFDHERAWVVLIKPNTWERHGLKPWLEAAKKRLRLSATKLWRVQVFAGIRYLLFGENQMAKKAKRTKRVAWTKQHVRELKAHSRAKTSVARISKVMKRTAGALRQKAMVLGLPIGHRR